ncbi:MAG: nucleotidyltransferase family protein [Lachnospiraceae bacterium]|nr:nucleotidyltransferase family protein [Lachnospiraceae bacterium]
MRFHAIMMASGFGHRFGSNKLLVPLEGKPLYRHVLDRLLSVAKTEPLDITVVTQYEAIEQELAALCAAQGNPTLRELCAAHGDPARSELCVAQDDPVLPLYVVHNGEAAEGQAASIRLGTASVLRRAGENRLSVSSEMEQPTGIPAQSAQEKQAGKPESDPQNVAPESMRTQASPDDYLIFFVGDQPYLKEETIHHFLERLKAGKPLIQPMKCNGRFGNPVAFSMSLAEELLALQGDVGGRVVIKAHADEVHPFEDVTPDELRDMDRPEDFSL